MNPFYFEEKFQEYKRTIGTYNFNLSSLQLLINFYQELLTFKNQTFIEICLVESIPFLTSQLKSYSCFGHPLFFSDSIIETANLIIDTVEGDKVFKDVLIQLDRIKEERKILHGVLEGKSVIGNNKFSISFLVIEKIPKQDQQYSLVESLSISINKNRKSDRNVFNIVPSLPKIEEKLQRQIKDSWEFATKFLKSKYSRSIPNLEITIRFVNKLGIYEGDSLGIALTIGFIEELFAFFDFRERLVFSNDIITTGPNDENGKVSEVSKSIIEMKSLAAFYSKAQIFLLPLDDFSFAEHVINAEKEKYPERNLEIIPVKNISDVLNRRDLLEVKNQNILKWGSGKLFKNKALFLLFVLFTIISISFYYLNLDKNPSKLELVDGRYLVKNKQDKVLWYKETELGEKYSDNKTALWNKYRFYDVDNDGLNEVLMVHLKDSHNLYLFDDDGKQIWSYLHYDSLESKNEKFTNHFSIYGIIDTIHSNSSIEVLVYLQHNTYYPTGILKLDLNTGKPVGDILWHPGSITGAILNDWNKDGKKEIIAGGPANGMNRAYLFSVDHDKLKGTFPTADNYKFLNMELAEINKYILFPKTDYAELFFPKYNAPMEAPIVWSENIISIGIGEGSADALYADFSYSIRLNRNLDPINCTIGDAQITIRDRLVKEGKLNPPYTASKEFHESILKNIEYWDGEKFVKY